MDSQASRLFSDIFGFDPIILNAKASWLPSFDQLLSCDPEMRRFFISAKGVSDKHCEGTVSTLNRYLSREAGYGYETVFPFASYVKEAESDDSAITIDIAALEPIKKKLREKARYNYRDFSTHYNHFVDSELDRIARDAFNLNVDKAIYSKTDRFLTYIPIWDEKPDGERIDNIGLLLCSHGSNDLAIFSYGLLAQHIEERFARAAMFLRGSAFLPPEMAEKIENVLGPDGRNMPFERVVNPKYPNQYWPVFDMNKARQMADAGLCVDLDGLVRRHVAYASGNMDEVFGQHNSAMRATANRLGLKIEGDAHHSDAITYRGEAIFSFRGASDITTCSSIETGRPMPDEGDEFHDYAKAKFRTNLEIPYLYQEEKQNLAAGLETTIAAALANSAIGHEPVSIAVTDEYYSALKIPYDVINLLLRHHKIADAAPLFEKYGELQRERIDRASAASGRIAAAFGYARHHMFSDSVSCFLKDLFRRARSEARFDFDFQRDMWANEPGFPYSQSIFADQAERMRQIIGEAKLAGIDIATDRGSETRHWIRFEFRIASIEQAEHMADGLFALQDRLLPHLGQAVERAAPGSAFGRSLFGYVPEEDPAHQRVSDLAFGAAIWKIEKIRQHTDADELDEGPGRKAMESVGSYIGYLAKSRDDANPDIRNVAEAALAEVSATAPVFAGLVAGAEKRLAPA